MKVNWKARLGNKVFWVAFIPALALLVTTVLDIFGVTVQLDGLVKQLIKVVEAVFAILALWGVVVDPTTEGASDSIRAMGYDKPWKDIPEDDV